MDRKLTMMGFEIPDLLLIFLTISILNFVFGRSDFKLFLVWLPALTLATVIRVGKHGKPDNFLIHLFKFYLRPKYFSAFAEPTKWKSPPRTKI